MGQRYHGPMRPEQESLAAALDQVGDRWSLQVIEALIGGPRRFADLGDQLPGIAPNVLSARLKQLERLGIVIARPYSRRPPRVDYELTARGAELADVVRLLARWGSGDLPEGASIRHDACGTALETRWYCPTCADVVEHVGAEETKIL